MTEPAHKRLTIDTLITRFFGGNPPALIDTETLHGAMARQIIGCHALIHHELSEAIDPSEDEWDEHSTPGESREGAYDRVGSLARLIGELTDVIRPASDQAPPEKRHAMRIEVNRTTTPALPPAPIAAAPARLTHDAYEDMDVNDPMWDGLARLRNMETEPEWRNRLWPDEAYCDDDGRIVKPLRFYVRYRGYDLNKLRRHFGLAPYQGTPLPHPE